MLSHLNPTEVDRLQVFLAAELARRILAHGLRLNAPEATALIADEMHLAARAGKSYDEVAAIGMNVLTAERVMDGVPDLVAQVNVEVLLEEGTRLIVLRRPIRAAVPSPGART